MSNIQQSSSRGHETPLRRRAPRYWSGLSVGLFVLTLAILHWGLHYRLEQYESARTAGTAIPMAKMWLGDRSHAAAATIVGAEQGPLFTAEFIFFGLLLSVCMQTRLKRYVASGMEDTRQWIRPPLWTHGHPLFFRPPPVSILL